MNNVVLRCVNTYPLGHADTRPDVDDLTTAIADSVPWCFTIPPCGYNTPHGPRGGLWKLHDWLFKALFQGFVIQAASPITTAGACILVPIPGLGRTANHDVAHGFRVPSIV